WPRRVGCRLPSRAGQLAWGPHDHSCGIRVRVVLEPVQPEFQEGCRHSRHELSADESAEFPPQCDRPRGWPCPRPAPQQRPDHADVRPSLDLPTRPGSLRSPPHVSTTGRRETLPAVDVSVAMEGAMSYSLYNETGFKAGFETALAILD